MSNHAALERLVRLWNEWHQNPSQRAEKNFGPFKNIFAHLLDVRPWSVEDRIRDTGILDAWEEDLVHETGLIRFEVGLLSLRGEPGGERWDERHTASLLKTLLVHGASWSRSAEVIEAVFRDQILEEVGNDAKRAWQPLSRLQASFLGYGEVSPERALFCTDRRVTLIGWGTLENGGGHLFEVPLPEALSGVRVKRRLVVTLGWITPVNFAHRKYRRAFLWFDPPEDEFGFCADHEGVHVDIARRGTVQHQIYASDKAIPIAENAATRIQVNCAEHAGSLADEIPYAIAVTLELAQPILASIYDQIREKSQARIRLET